VHAADDVHAWYRRGMDLLSRGSPAAAAQVLQRAATAEPGSRSVREALARAQFDAGRYEEARATFDRKVSEYRAIALSKTAHARTPDIVANLQAGFEMYLHFAVACCALDDADLRVRQAKVGAQWVDQKAEDLAIGVGDNRCHREHTDRPPAGKGGRERPVCVGGQKGDSGVKGLCCLRLYIRENTFSIRK
jgi:tetratricopeptide (TPR) repeat protein